MSAQFQSPGEPYPGVGALDATATMKLFVGQIPKSMAEDDLRRYFEPFGPLIEVAIIRDRVTGTHRGCAFVTYESAASGMACISALHDKVTLEPMTCAMQVKPADGQSERRVFVGQLDSRHDRPFLESLFERFGPIEDIRFLRESDSVGQGAAVISFRTQESAQAAVSAMDKMLPHEGAETPLMVRFAFESKRGGGSKRAQQSSAAGASSSGKHHGWTLPLKLPMPAGQSAPHQDGGLALAHSPVYPPGSSALYGGATMLTGMYGAFPSPTPYSAVPVVASGPGLDSPQPPPSTSVSSSHGGRPLASEGGSPPTTVPIAVPQTYHFPPEYAAYAYSYAPTTATYAYGLGYAPTAAPGHFAVTSLAHGMSKPRTGSLEGGEPSSRGTHAHHQASVAYSMIGPHYRDGGVDPTASTVGPKQSQGPPGANLFVYHLPPQLRDGDLRELFRTFGNILSAKVYTDRRTEESKGFGFVSYDNPLSAEAAIASMNGYPIGMKRLKVQHKRGYLEETRYAAERLQREAYINNLRQNGDNPVDSLVASMRISE